MIYSFYINDLPEGLTMNAKLFADDTSLFSVSHVSPAFSAASLNDDLPRCLRTDARDSFLSQSKYN